MTLLKTFLVIVSIGDMISFLKSSSAGNNFDKFSSNDGLASSVEGDSQFVDHFLRVFAGVVHSRHSG